VVLLKLQRRLLGIPAATIGRAQALALAQAECERRGYPTRPPLRVEERLREYVVWILGDVAGVITLPR
jgi:hypothetical protein